MNWYSNDFPITRETDKEMSRELRFWGSSAPIKETLVTFPAQLSQHEWHAHSNPEKHPEETL